MKRLLVLFASIMIAITFLAICAPTASSAARAQASVDLPVLMYHGVLNSKKGQYFVTPAQLEADIVALQGEGYETVFPSDVINYVYGKGSLPAKPVLLTFDDGFFNNLYYALPILKRHNAKANLNVIGFYCDRVTNGKEENKSNPNFSYLTWEQVGEMSRSGCFEIGSHSYNMHDYRPRFGIDKLSSETEEKYRTVLADDLRKNSDLIERYTSIRPSTFAYPFGERSRYAYSVLKKEGFLLYLTCYEKGNKISVRDTKCLNCVYRYNRDGSYSTAKVLQKIKR